MKKKDAAIELARKFIQSDPLKAAQALETLSLPDAALMLKELPPAAAAQCLEHLSPLTAAQLLEKNSEADAAAILVRMDRHHAADSFRRFTPEFSKAVVPLLAGEFARDMGEILTYPKDTAGRVMHTEFLAFRGDMKVREVIAKLRQIAKKHLPAAYCYVVDPSSSLLGVLNMRDLLLAPPDSPIENVMIREVARVSPFADKEELAAVFARRNYLAMPVVNETGRLIGVVSAKNIVASTEEEATEDLQILFGASAEERVHSAPLFKVRKRLPWLHINLLTVFLAGAVVAVFQGLIAKMAILAVFLPVVAGQGGNAGIQTLSVVLRGMIMREIEPGSAAKIILTELWVGFINGVVTGLAAGLLVWLWKGNPYMGFVLGAAMVVNLVVAGFSGAIIPLALKKLGFDPAHSSGIIITTMTDVMGFLALLSLAWLFQGKLI